MKADSDKFILPANNRLEGEICSEPAIYVVRSEKLNLNETASWKKLGALNSLSEISKFLRHPALRATHAYRVSKQ